MSALCQTFLSAGHHQKSLTHHATALVSPLTCKCKSSALALNVGTHSTIEHLISGVILRFRQPPATLQSTQSRNTCLADSCGSSAQSRSMPWAGQGVWTSDKVLSLKSLMQPLSNESSTVTILSYKGWMQGILEEWWGYTSGLSLGQETNKRYRTQKWTVQGQSAYHYMHLIQNPRNCYGNWKATNTIIV